MPRNILFFDDDFKRHRHFHNMEGTPPFDVKPDDLIWHCYNVGQAIATLRDGPRFDLVCLDHDMDLNQDWDGIDNGQNVAHFIADHMPIKKQPKQIIVHSHNPDAAYLMCIDMRETGLHQTMIVPYPLKANEEAKRLDWIVNGMVNMTDVGPMEMVLGKDDK